MPADAFDLVIIGAGPGGLTAANFAARLGAKVALIEKDRIGGDCTWTGCVPSKALIKAAKVAHTVSTAHRFGVNPQSCTVDMETVRAYVRDAIARVYRLEEPDELRRRGIEVLLGEARFVNTRSVSINGRIIHAKKFLIVTGAHPRIPPIQGLDRVPFLTYQRIFENDRLPASMIVAGGGPIGLEIAQAYSRLGARVTVVAKTLLPKDEPDSRDLIRGILESEGIRFVNATAESVRMEGNEIVLRTSAGQISGDLLFVATGRAPNVHGLDLENAGVTYSDAGIPVDGQLRTTAKNIYAAGDVTGGPQFTHFAGWQAFQAARNALLPGAASGFPRAIPWVTFTDPEVARAGLSEAEARAKFGNNIRVRRWELTSIDRAICEGDDRGFIKIIAKPDTTLLGVSAVAARAGEVISELMLALNGNMKLSAIASAIHPYPAYSTAIQQIAAEMVLDRALSGFRGKIARALRKR